MKRYVLAALVLSFLLVVAGCRSGPEGPVARVNGIDIAREVFNYELETELDTYRQQGYQLTADDIRLVKEHVLDRLINNAMLLDAAEKKGISADTVDVDGEISLIMSQFQDEAEFLLALEEINVTLEEYRRLVAEFLIFERLFQHELDLDNVQVSDEEVQVVFDDFMEEYADDESLDPDTLWDSIRVSITEDRINQLIFAFIAELRDSSFIEYFDY